MVHGCRQSMLFLLSTCFYREIWGVLTSFSCEFLNALGENFVMGRITSRQTHTTLPHGPETRSIGCLQRFVGFTGHECANVCHVPTRQSSRPALTVPQRQPAFMSLPNAALPPRRPAQQLAARLGAERHPLPVQRHQPPRPSKDGAWQRAKRSPSMGSHPRTPGAGVVSGWDRVCGGGCLISTSSVELLLGTGRFTRHRMFCFL